MFCSRVLWCLLTLLVTSAAFAFVAPTSNNRTGKRHLKEKVVLRPQLQADVQHVEKSIAGGAMIVRRDRLTGVPRLLSGAGLGRNLLLHGRTDSYLDIIRRYVVAGRELLGVTYRDLRVVPDATFINSDTAFYKFDVYRNDLKIEDATLMFRFRYGHLVQVVNRTFAEAEIADEHAAGLSDRQLRQLVARELGTNKYTAQGYAWRVVKTDDRYELVKVRTFQQELGEGNRVQVDPRSGRVFEVAPSRFYSGMGRAADDTAMVQGYARASLYPRWYREEIQQRPLAEIAIGVTSPQSTQPAPASVMTDVEGRYTITASAVPSIDNIVGAKVRIFNQTGPRVTVAGVKVGNMWETAVGRQKDVMISSDKIMAQSMVFYHADLIFRIAAQYITTPWFNVPLASHTNLARSCNAHWDTRVSTINFYSGNHQCANTGLISDIIYHEWGHGLDAKTGGILDGAYSEGFGDIMSVLITKSPIIGIGFGLNGRVVRDLEPDKIYPQDARGGVHAEGQVIGSTFWDLFTEFKKYYTEDEALHILRKYAFQMIFTAEKYTDVYDALLVIDDNDGDLTNSTPNFCLINEPFSKHGLANFERRCLVISFVRNDVNELLGNSNGIIEPGERIELTPWIENVTEGKLQGLRGLASSDSEHLNWENNTAQWQEIDVGSKTPSSVPLVFNVAENATCGAEFSIKLDFEVAKRRKSFSEKFRIGHSAGQKSLYQSVGLPIEIPDQETVEAAVIVDGEQWHADTVIHEARLRFAIMHSFMGDLNISLIAPNGEEIQVKKLRGRGNRTLVFDEDISDLLRERSGKGEWRLRVTDTRRADYGILQDFALTLTPKHFVCNPST